MRLAFVRLCSWLSAVLLVTACTRSSREAVAVRLAADGVATDPETTHWVLMVDETAPYWLGPEWWARLERVPDQLGPGILQLTRDGESVPFLWLPSPQGAGLLFYAETSPSEIGPAASYLLRLDAPGEQMAPAALDPPTVTVVGECQTETWTHVGLERDLAYRSTAPLERPWLWSSLRPPQMFTMTLPLTNTVAHPVSATLTLWGQSRAPENPDHHARVLWNGTALSDRFWDGSALESWTVSLPAPTQDMNTLALGAPGGTDAPVELTWIDRLDVTWRQRLAVDGGRWQRWEPEAAASACWTVSGDLAGAEAAESLVAFLVGEDGHPERAPLAWDAASERAVVAQRPGYVGWVGLPWEAPSPKVIRSYEAVEVDDLKAVTYLAVVPDALQRAVAPLITARQEERFETHVLTPSAVYDTFGRGLPEALAIQQMVQTLEAEGALAYLLLVGDTTADSKALWDNDASLVPTAWVRTGYVGHTASDTTLVTDVDGDIEVSVGRLPAASPQEAEAMVRKTLAWAPTPRLMLVGDDELSFSNLVDELNQMRSADLLLDAGAADARAQALRWLRDDAGTLVYVGHGSLPLLGDERLLTTEDSGGWDGPTVVVAWSCLCANFTHPAYTGLAEAWLRDPDGVAAFVGPTGETTTSEQRAMALTLQQEVAQGARLGNALRTAWTAAQSEDARLSFLLLGDPALRVMPKNKELE